MKLAQMQNDINKALHGFELQDVEQSFGRAADRITAMRSEADARSEIANTSVSARLAELSDQQVDVEAEQALVELEKKLGLAPAAAPVAATGGAAVQQDDDIDRQLKELEQKLGQQ
jgi:phage shock protein A